MVVTDHEEERAPIGIRRRDVEQAAEPAPNTSAKLLRRLREIADQLKSAGVVIDEVRCEDSIARGRLPAELRADALTLVTDATREDVAAVPEAAQELGRLSRMSERVRDVSDAHRASERRGDAQALLEIPEQRLAGDEQVIGEHVPGPDEQTLGTHQRLDARAIVRPLLEVVLDSDGVPVERERAERAVPLEQVEKLRHHRHEPRAIALEALVPLAIPVGVRHDERAPTGAAPQQRDRERSAEPRDDADERATDHVERVMHADRDALEGDRDREEQRGHAPRGRDVTERHRRAEREGGIA